MPFCCVECKPCNGARALFKCRRPTFQLRRAFGKVKVGGGRRRAGSFSSVRAVFWPLMSMRSDVDDRPPSASTDDSGARAPSPSLDDTPGGAAQSMTAARVLALQARLGEGASDSLPLETATGASRAPSPARHDTPPGPASTTSARALALQTRLGGDATAPLQSPTSIKAGSIRVQAVREHAKVVLDNGDVDDVEEACRSFEKHLMEMLVDERKVMDLTDVEELLCCWEKLRCPVFVQLVGRFYGDLCMDLFSGSDGADVPSE